MTYSIQPKPARFSMLKMALSAFLVLFNTSIQAGNLGSKPCNPDTEKAIPESPVGCIETEPVPEHTANIYPYTFPREGQPEITITDSRRYIPLIQPQGNQPALVLMPDPEQIPSGGASTGFNNFYSYSVNTYDVSYGENQFTYMVAGTNGYEYLGYVLPESIMDRRDQFVVEETLKPGSAYRGYLPDLLSVQNNLPPEASHPDPDPITTALNSITRLNKSGHLPEELTRFSQEVFRPLNAEYLTTLNKQERRSIEEIQNISFQQRAQPMVQRVREEEIDFLILVRTNRAEFLAIMEEIERQGLTAELIVATHGAQTYYSRADIQNSTQNSMIASAFIRINQPVPFESPIARPVNPEGSSAVEGYGSNLNRPAAIDVSFQSGGNIRLISALTGPRENTRETMLSDINKMVTEAPSSSMMLFYSFKSDSYKSESEKLTKMNGKAITNRHPIIFLRDAIGGRSPYNADSQEAKVLRDLLRAFWSSSLPSEKPNPLQKHRTPDNDDNGSTGATALPGS